MGRLFRLLSAAIAVGLLTGCGGPDFRPPANAPEDWQQTMREEAPGGWVVWGYGTGAAPESLAAGRSQAASSARSDLAERVDTRVAELSEGLVERLVGEGNKELEKTDVRAVVKRAGEIAVNGATVARRERDSDGTWHALVRAELRPALGDAADERGLSSTSRKRLMDEADRILRGEPEGEGS